ncbi:MAG: ACP S-malonyltransferase, partial [Actinomycetota bacterium]|nr:ACP S-malonyltransferase [Actinomycetota bacterium]
MPIAVVFPGQGCQFIGMADPWATHPAGTSVLEEAGDALGRDIVAGAHDEAALATTEFAQPALLACGVAAFRVLEAEGLTGVVGAAGHSLGEFSALVAAGVLGLGDALRVVVVRGEAMQRAAEARPGTMSALLGAGPGDADALCDETRGDDVLVVANRNSPVQSVISGSVAAIERAEVLAAERKIRAVRLQVAGAFHSALMEPAIEPILRELAGLELTQASFPIASNVSGALVSDAAELRSLLERHVISPVRWQDDVQALAAAGATTFLECGPG